MSKELSIPDFMGTPAGRFLREWESSQAAGVVGDVFGYSAVQIGLPELDLLRGNRIATHIQIIPPEARNLKNISSQDPLNRILADFTEIPLASESQDLVVLPHALDFWETDAPAQKVLREAARILVPEGRIVLTAFNRAGLWSLRQRLSWIGLGGPFLPDAARPIALKRLQDWLSLLGFEVDRDAEPHRCRASSVRVDESRGRPLVARSWQPCDAFRHQTYCRTPSDREHGVCRGPCASEAGDAARGGIRFERRIP